MEENNKQEVRKEELKEAELTFVRVEDDKLEDVSGGTGARRAMTFEQT